MAYPSLIIYYSNLNNLEIIIKKLGIHINLLNKILNFLLNFKKLNYLLEQKKSCFKMLQDKFLCTYHSFTVEVSLSQIINIKKHTRKFEVFTF